MLNYNSNGYLSVQLPQGPSTDSYKIYLLVYITDDTDGSTMYYLSDPIQVQPDNSLAQSLSDSISSRDPNNLLLIDLNSGNLNIVAKNVIALTTILNFQSSDTSSSSSSTTSTQNSTSSNAFNVQIAELREFMVEKISAISVSGISLFTNYCNFLFFNCTEIIKILAA